MEQKVGIEVCIDGEVTLILGSRICHMKRGDATIVSPALPTVQVDCSSDYHTLSIVVDMHDITAETTPYLSTMLPVINESAPVARLDESMFLRVISENEHIRSRESICPDTELFRHLNNRIITLLRLQIIFEVMYAIAAKKNDNVSRQSHGEKTFIRFMQSLSSHISERLSVSQYAEEANLSVRHFSSVIKSYTGQTPMQWIIAYTISQAKHLLQNEDKTIKEISDILGFPEQFTFRKYFKTHTGMSPTQFRKQI